MSLENGKETLAKKIEVARLREARVEATKVPAAQNKVRWKIALPVSKVELGGRSGHRRTRRTLVGRFVPQTNVQRTWANWWVSALKQKRHGLDESERGWAMRWANSVASRLGLSEGERGLAASLRRAA